MLNKRTRFFMRIFFLFLLLSSCSNLGTFGYRSPGPYFGGLMLGSGTYVQDFKVEPLKGESYSFRAVFERHEHSLFLEAISPKGARIFRVKDSLTLSDEPRVELFSSELAAGPEELRAFYKCLRPLFLLRDKPSVPSELVRERYTDSRPRLLSSSPGYELAIDEFDWDGHARKLSLANPFARAKIVLREYKAEKE